MKYVLLLVLLFLLGAKKGITQAQTDTLCVHFTTHWGDKDSILEKLPFVDNSSTVKVEVLKYYISSILFENKNEVVFKESNSYHLIDYSKSEKKNIKVVVPVGLSFDKIKFTLGIDSSTSVSGAMGGDLDPTKGMYWAWHSGYINFKLEGSHPNSPERGNEFKYHLGGYTSPFLNKQDIELNCTPSSNIFIGLDLSTFLENIDLSLSYRIMSPSKKAVELAQKLQKLFFVYEKN